jgi:zinc transport system substrate-binding protein
MISILIVWYGAAVKTRIVLFFSLAVSTSFLGTACSGTSGDGNKIVAAFYPLAFAAEQVGGGEAVANLTPPGAEPHDLELSPGDVRRVIDARLVVYLGRGFQPALERALDQRHGPSVDVLEGQSLATDATGALDPHVWLDPIRFATITQSIATALGDPARATPLVRKLQGLDREFRRGLAQCTRSELVTTHAAFGYLAARYRLRQVPLTGLAPEVEPSAAGVASLVKEVERSGATTIFTEPLVSPRLAETVAREAGVGTATLNPIEGLTGAQLDAGDDYFSLMRANLVALRKALGCR